MCLLFFTPSNIYLTQVTLETLSVVGWERPISKSENQTNFRGVRCSSKEREELLQAQQAPQDISTVALATCHPQATLAIPNAPCHWWQGSALCYNRAAAAQLIILQRLFTPPNPFCFRLTLKQFLKVSHFHHTQLHGLVCLFYYLLFIFYLFIYLLFIYWGFCF